MRKIKIVYIATGKHYASMFDKWVRNIEFFAQEDVKNVVLLTNEDIDTEQYGSLINVNVEKHHIMHFPWPIVTLFKFHLIYNHIEESDDLVFYFNANFLPYPSINAEDFGDGELCFFRSKKQCERSHWQEENPYNDSLKYILGTVIVGNYEEMRKCCEFVIDHVNGLLKDNTIERKHDESALNHYLCHLDGNGGRYRIMDLEDIGDLDNENHDNGNDRQKETTVEKLVIE